MFAFIQLQNKPEGQQVALLPKPHLLDIGRAAFREYVQTWGFKQHFYSPPLMKYPDYLSLYPSSIFYQPSTPWFYIRLPFYLKFSQHSTESGRTVLQFKERTGGTTTINPHGNWSQCRYYSNNAKCIVHRGKLGTNTPVQGWQGENVVCVCMCMQEKLRLKEEIRGIRGEFICKENRGPQVWPCAELWITKVRSGYGIHLREVKLGQKGC